MTTWMSSCSQVRKLRINGSGLQGDVGDAVNPSSSILHPESKQLQSVDAAQRRGLIGRNGVRVVHPRPENLRVLSDATGGWVECIGQK